MDVLRRRPDVAARWENRIDSPSASSVHAGEGETGETDGVEPLPLAFGLAFLWDGHNTLGIARAVLPVQEYGIVYSRDAA